MLDAHVKHPTVRAPLRHLQGEQPPHVDGGGSFPESPADGLLHLQSGHHRLPAGVRTVPAGATPDAFERRNARLGENEAGPRRLAATGAVEISSEQTAVVEQHLSGRLSQGAKHPGVLGPDTAVQLERRVRGKRRRIAVALPERVQRERA